MPTPDFEEWLERQDIPVEETTEVTKYQKYVAEEYGFASDKQQEVVARQYEQKYEVLPQLGITSTERKYTYRGEPYSETRYAIEGAPGLWGRTSAMRIAAERLEERGQPELAESYTARMREAQEYGFIRRKRGGVE